MSSSTTPGTGTPVPSTPGARSIATTLPVAGKTITVRAWIADKYLRRGKNYIVTEAVSVDEDGRLIDRVITHELKQPTEVGKKWGG
ncbi:hypothetical protein GBAR_LOCUS28857 [Geodia barretti]|uniref:Uncharacterized protein n=1 Tax=Geodia barretti TaxID=519541 RepID=A0AA35XIG6_GEOBA|nr:hypothetical protein GBAR_LOCUS28857 [Geodia barretti]